MQWIHVLDLVFLPDTEIKSNYSDSWLVELSPGTLRQAEQLRPLRAERDRPKRKLAKLQRVISERPQQRSGI